MKTLYYTITLQTQPGEGYYDDLTGDKIISVYRINDNKLISMGDILCNLTDTSEEMIHSKLEELRHKEEFKLVLL